MDLIHVTAYINSIFEFFSLLHDNTPAHKAASVCQFLTPLPQKMLQRFVTPRTLHFYLRQNGFWSPS
jgi:hypothetical protein